MSHERAVVGAILLALFCGCTPTGKEAPSSADATVATAQPAAAGVRVFIDPVTGQQRAATAQEWAGMMQREQEKKRLESAAPPPLESLPPSASNEVTLTDGTKGYVLGEAAKTSLRVCKGADGVVRVDHECPTSTPTSTSDATQGKAP